MRTGAAAGHRGYFHEAALYGSDDELLSMVVPFLDDAVDAGEPTLVVLPAPTQPLVRAAVKDPSKVSFSGAGYARPSSVIKAFREMLAGHVAGGAEQIRVVGAVSHPGLGQPWDWWARYEAAITRAYDDYPMWSLCVYDTRITPAHVLADVERTHPYRATADGQHLPNDRFEEPERFLSARLVGGADPIEADPPAITLIDPTPGAARRAVREVGHGGPLDADELDDLVIAVNEAVTNAVCHGRPPVQLRVWVGPGRMVATVADRGTGPVDPFAGLLPTTVTSSGGVGLWLTHEICSHVTLAHTDDDGYTIRLVAGQPHLR